ncbi:MAG: hypothetical protein HQK70_00070 [Desulfamplus sp.]|nr:hypothetical protein [Desulfamplus sp.]
MDNSEKSLNIQNLLRTCVSEEGQFIVGIHKPSFNVTLLRDNRYIQSLGALTDNTLVKNEINFPDKDVEEKAADVIYEIPNPFPFRGVTYINSAWADQNVGKPEQIKIPPASDCSLYKMLNSWLFESQNSSKQIKNSSFKEFLIKLPSPLKIALAQSTTDPDDLIALIPLCCTVIHDENGNPSGLMFKKDNKGRIVPDIHDHTLFELIANNPYLPDSYKRVMVLKPGIQGTSEITGEWLEINESKSHVFEYLRRNSYIPWGHFAANMADDTVRYCVNDLTMADMTGMRHLYYQRTYVRLAEQLNLVFNSNSATLCSDALEEFRINIITTLKENKNKELAFNGSLWGWNFGFGYAQSGYRLHASHQQIHQQYAMIPKRISNMSGLEVKIPSNSNSHNLNQANSQTLNQTENQTFLSYACGDMVADFIASYKSITGRQFFDNYINAVRTNKRTDFEIERKINDKNSLPSSLIVYEDQNIMLFVPKAQTSQWELQIMALKPCGNILEADSAMRYSLDRAILASLQILESMGARMVTSIEFSKRFDSADKDQRLLYAFMPKIPESPGAFSEAQLRWINGHYPEDFAQSCRAKYSILTL